VIDNLHPADPSQRSRLLTRRDLLRGGLALGIALAAPDAARAADSAARFAVIGDFGLSGSSAAAVAELVHAREPEFVVTSGDNNYPAGQAKTIDRNIGQYYHRYIAPYKGTYGPGAEVNRFFPVLGNHDWDNGTIDPYYDYFTLPGNERYYSFGWGPLRFFMLDSAITEPDGYHYEGAQGEWFRKVVRQKYDEPWRIAVFHHPPYSSGLHGSCLWMRWPFAELGINVVLNGHDHNYERVQLDGVTYVVNGLGGGSRYKQGTRPAEGSRVFFNEDWGALFVEATARRLRFEFATVSGLVVDAFSLVGPGREG
jgi:hypothetical protein